MGVRPRDRVGALVKETPGSSSGFCHEDTGKTGISEPGSWSSPSLTTLALGHRLLQNREKRFPFDEPLHLCRGSSERLRYWVVEKW